MGCCCGSSTLDEADQSLLGRDRRSVDDVSAHCADEPFADIAVEPGALDFGPQLRGQWSVAQTVRVRSTGTAPLVVQPLVLSDAVQYAIANDHVGGRTLAAHTEGTFDVRLRPSAAGPRPAQLTIRSNARSMANAVGNLTGTGVAPHVDVAAALAFGTLGLNGTDRRSLTIRNTGTAPLTLQAAVLGGGDAGQFALPVALNNLVVQPNGSHAFDVTFTPTGAGAKAATLTLSSDDPDQPQAVVNLTGTGVVRLLRMHLDEDRDGQLDPTPAAAAQWQWGAQGRGAVLAVRHGTPMNGALPDPNGVIRERRPLELRWTGAVPADTNGWQAQLVVSRPDVVRVYLNDQLGNHVPNRQLGVPPLAYTNANELDLTQRLQNQPLLRLFLDVKSYKLGANDTYPNQEQDWRVTLTFVFTDGGHEVFRQAVEVRVAPWLMASDLEPTEHLGFKDYPAVENNAYTQRLPTAFRAHLPGGVNAVATKPPANVNNPKAFARDVLKSGFVTVPGLNHRALLRDLDDQSPITRLTNAILGAQPALSAFREQALDIAFGGQGGGGNMLVTPPLVGHPFGRVVYGHTDGRPCELADFFAAQRYQAPIVLDSAWLHVGHVDEYVSFLPDPTNAQGWGHKVLLASARLGHALCHLAAARPNTNQLDADIATAIQLSEQARLAGQTLVPTATLQQAFGVPPPPGAAAVMNRVAGYVENPPVPAGTDGLFVRWSDGANFPVEHASQYLANGATPAEQWLQFAQTAQTHVDADRAILQPALGVGQANFLEIPVVFGTDNAGLVGRSADSVNMLILTNAGCVCLVPKPFGPVAAGRYVFERCIELLLQPYNPTLHFINDWDDLHVNDGEIHCGTNQVPVARALSWWNAQP